MRTSRCWASSQPRMESVKDKGNGVPLTPHHTQMLAMLMFSNFQEAGNVYAAYQSPGGYNLSAAIMQMKTGEANRL